MNCQQSSTRYAVVVAHPAHLLTIAGAVLRHEPETLFLTSTSDGAGVGQTELIGQALDRIGLSDKVQSLEMDETESYRHALAQNFQFHLEFIEPIVDWLEQVQPDSLLGDAFEASNYQHDIGCCLLAAAMSEYTLRTGRSIQRYEFPLSCQFLGEDASVQYGRFVTEDVEKCVLSDSEMQMKIELVLWASSRNDFVNQVSTLFPSDPIERFRSVDPDRNYSVPPPGLALHYDRRGIEEVAAGRHQNAINFQSHFIPLVQAVDRWKSLRTRVSYRSAVA